ncbi:peptidase inhibitor family I36 protein [Actinosynnema sp. NPDC053489]|uniref:peptidase inhibitor family I36 protein n=1 Tax=Actinosynnema sp. NPDC053489 TaxID=3363916 RepID=UPI0037C4F095
MRRAVLVLAGVLFLAVGTGMVGFAAVANAEPALRSAPEVVPTAAPAGCHSSNVCFWANNNYNDGPGELSGTNPDWRRFAHGSCGGGTWNNCASSVYNNGTQCWADLWDGLDYALGSRGGLSLSRGTGIANLGSWDFDNAISSNSWSRCA